MADEGERFIDAEEHGFEDQTQTFDKIILEQIRECVKVLSKDPIRMTEIANKKGLEQKATNLYDEEYNHVDSLKCVMSPFIQGEDRKKVDAVYIEIERFQSQLGEQRVQVYGQGIKKVKDMSALPLDHLVYKKLSMFKAEKARILFELLINIYYTKKAEIASFSYEES